jgi:hypothetical protein
LQQHILGFDFAALTARQFDLIGFPACDIMLPALKSPDSSKNKFMQDFFSSFLRLYFYQSGEYLVFSA